MSLREEVNDRLKTAMKSNDTVAKDLYRVIKGEYTQLETSRESTGPATDKQVAKIAQHIIDSGKEIIKLLPESDARIEKTQKEIDLLESFLADYIAKQQAGKLSEEDIVAHLNSVIEEIKAANNDGQATGVAMKYFKSQGVDVDGKMVKLAIQQIRNG